MHGGFYSTLRPGDSSEAATWFDKYNCVLLVLRAETYCAMGDLGSVRDYLIKAAKQAIEQSVMTDSEFVPLLAFFHLLMWYMQGVLFPFLYCISAEAIGKIGSLFNLYFLSNLPVMKEDGQSLEKQVLFL